ncbi:hypothetical protein CERZMDRAFT_47351 [Cercospora zeae-maydis SCOH1-5]|uniref:DUF3074 domain-containing protein n=1 Tax=Cercospora zeae-maydis SCOH1-5 TaxID=717836 RepID=A0A6A6F8G9_9PEZI|nr:hypothetical protein CERZMDRAFT_47351 [Cercospora zeae-maydis SCOH1-5]
MTELFDALASLAPAEWSDIPTENLKAYARSCLSSAELIINSVPPTAEGTPFHASAPSFSQPNAAKTHKDMVFSNCRPHHAFGEYEQLHKNWGKPYKFKKEQNPYNVNVYKMAANDRHGAWFARSSVHEGLSFERTKRAMMRELVHSSKIPGGPGAGAVRGIAADRCLERVVLPELSAKLEVYELSAAFPAPVTPRDFVAMIMSSDNVLTEKSAVTVGGEKYVPRHFVVLSKPVIHHDAPVRSGMVRGQYESVEMIREIPLTTRKATSTTNLLRTQASSGVTRERQQPEAGDAEESELNPVEWIMVTRSDPGGGIPRFLVERGTPESMLGDVPKFFEWACALDDIPHPDDDGDEKETIPARGTDTASGHAPFEPASGHHATFSDTAPQESSPSGYLSSITDALGAGIEAYAPTAVSRVVLPHLKPDDGSPDDESDTSFMSAEELRRVASASEIPDAAQSTDNFSLMSGEHSEDSKVTKGEKEVHKLVKKREKLEQQLAKKQLAEEQKSGKTRDKIERELKKTVEKHRKEIDRLELKRAKEERKAEQRRTKKDEQYKMSLVTRERDEFRGQADLLRRENALLRDQVAELLTQNTALTQRLGAVGGSEALQRLDQTLDGNQQSTSIKSMGSYR